MLTIRFFEEAVERLFLEGRMGGTAHTCIGQEAVAVGVAAALAPGDAMTSTHRGHGHFLACGADPGRVMAELFGRADGYSRGRGGSQMMMDTAIGFYGANGITGAGIPFAAGLALDARRRGKPRVVACLFGDGASNQGVFHETLNLASLWKLPVLFICENNAYAMSTAACAGLANPRVAERAASYRMPGVPVDGNDLPAVRQVVAEAAAQARDGGGPVLIEALTYRLSGHSRGDKREYRDRVEEEQAWTREPIKRFEAHLKQAGLIDDERIAARHVEALERVAAAIRFAEASPLPDPASVAAGVYA
jgi:pyruvate dehydrogenase E1 component alpha subunit